MRFCFAQNLFEASDFGGEDGAADAGESIVAATGVAIVGGGGAAGFFDEAMVHQLFEIVVEGAGAEFVLTLRLARDFLHDAVAVKIFGGQGKQNVELGGGEGQESVEVVFHGRKPIYRNPSIVVKAQFGWYLKKVDSRQLKVERGEEEKANAETRRAPRFAERLILGCSRWVSDSHDVVSEMLARLWLRYTRSHWQMLREMDCRLAGLCR